MNINNNSVTNKTNSSQSFEDSALQIQKKIRGVFKKKCERILLIQPLFFRRYQFLPLMVWSVYCTLGMLYFWYKLLTWLGKRFCPLKSSLNFLLE